jgi:uncharacterized protein with FMN-binding domain
MSVFVAHTARSVLAITGVITIAGTVVGCAGTGETEPPRQTSNYVAGNSESGPVSDPTRDTSATYRDGEYTATGGYNSPRGPETIDVAVTLIDDVVTAVEVTPDAVVANSVIFQNKFAEAIGPAAVGVDIDSLSIDRLAGSSLTGAGFMDALEIIRKAAAE